MPLELRRAHRPSRLSWRSVFRQFDLIVDIHLLLYLFGYPSSSEFGLPYAAMRHADPVMSAARERALESEYIRHMEAMLDLTMTQLEIERMDSDL